MLKLEDCGTIFLLLSFLGALVISWPALAFVFPARAGERFSALYVLGPNRMAEDYPFNVKENEEYRIYLGIENHMGSSAYYVLYVKLRSPDEPLPNSTAGVPSPLPALYEYRVILADEQAWEFPVVFSLTGMSFYGNSCTVDAFFVDGSEVDVDKVTSWDAENNGFYLELFFELWIFKNELDRFSFHDRFVGIWLNMTASTIGA